uniref:Uncharacterized protein n=1 Tax=Anguilla anguilla TaxID=7936 RepID=A0A0E9PM02_ANGAN
MFSQVSQTLPREPSALYPRTTVRLNFRISRSSHQCLLCVSALIHSSSTQPLTFTFE